MKVNIVLVGAVEDHIGTALSFYRRLLIRGKRRGELVTDPNVVIQADTVKKVVRIICVFQPGVVMQPRSGAFEQLPYSEVVGWFEEGRSALGVPGGWAGGVTPLDTQYIFPLVDGDNATCTVFSTGARLGAVYDGMDYGNLYWTNGDAAVSWRGTPTRHFQLPDTYDLPGFSIIKTKKLDSTPVYTAFGTKIYREGEVVYAPRYNWPVDTGDTGGRCLVLGAMQSPTGKLYAVLHSDHSRAPNALYIFSDGGRVEGDATARETYLATHPKATVLFETALQATGTWLVLASYDGCVDGWKIINEVSYPENGAPWFGDAYGFRFVCSNGDAITVDGQLSILSPPPEGKADDEGAWDDPTNFWFDSAYTFELPVPRTVFHEPEGYGTLSLKASMVSTTSHAQTNKTNETPGWRFYRTLGEGMAVGSTETSPCTVSNPAVAFKVIGDVKRPTAVYRVTYGKSSIPDTEIINSFADIPSRYGHTATYNCGTCGPNFSIIIIDNINILSGKLVYFNGQDGPGLYQIGTVTASGVSSWDHTFPATGWFNEDTHNTVTLSMWTSGSTYCGYTECLHQGNYLWMGVTKLTCTDYLSDTYLSNLVDYNGNEVTVPRAIAGYLTKVQMVETLVCS